MSLLLAALGRAHVEIGGDDGDGGEASPWPVSVGALSSGTRGGVSTLRRHCQLEKRLAKIEYAAKKKPPPPPARKTTAPKK